MPSPFRETLGVEGRTWAVVAVGAATWAGAAAARWWGGAAIVAVFAAGAVLVAAFGWRPVIGAVVVASLAGWWSGHGSAVREQAILSHETPAGQADLGVRLLTDPRQGDFGWHALAVADPPEPGRPAAVPIAAPVVPSTATSTATAGT